MKFRLQAEYVIGEIFRLKAELHAKHHALSPLAITPSPNHRSD